MPTPFAVMTWNVENHFKPGPKTPTQPEVTAAEYDAKLGYLAGVIGEHLPDVLALQEIGSRNAADMQALDDLHDRVLDHYPFKAVSERPDGRGIRVAFLSRREIVAVDHLVEFAAGELASVPDWPGKPPITKMGRGALRIDVEPAAGVRVRLITAHLKSKLVTYPSSGPNPRYNPKDEDERTRGVVLALLRRTAEAAAVRTYLNDLMQPGDATHTVVLGDFNDDPHAATSQMLLGPEDADATTDDTLDPFRLYNLVDVIPRRGGPANDKRFIKPEEAYSRIYLGSGELIDHILVSKGLLGMSAQMKQDQWRVREVRSFVEGIQKQSVTANPNARAGEERPDHAPVLARFEL